MLKSGMLYRRLVLIGVFILAAIAGALYYQFTKTPQYSVLELVELTPKVRFEGETVKIIGKVDRNVVCTLIACSEENQCCNSCGGSMVLIDINDSTKTVELLGRTEFEFQCSGTECDVQCLSPLVMGKTYIVTGTVEIETFNDGDNQIRIPKLRYISHQEVVE